MSKRITEEQKIQINELYAQIGIKSKVAKILGISPASVNKYLIDNYVPQNQREREKFQGKPQDFPQEILNLEKGEDIAAALIQLSQEEKEQLKELQKEIFV